MLFKVIKLNLLALIISLTVVELSLLFSSCSKTQPVPPLKNTQIYGLAEHLPTREMLSYQPGPEWVALVSPSIKPLVETFFKASNLFKGDILEGIKIDPVLSKIIGKDVESTLDNFRSIGIEVNKPCGFFYNILTGKWEVVGSFNDKEKILGIFPSIKKSYLKTAWYSFITRTHPYFVDTLTNVGIYFSDDYKVYISNDSGAIIKSTLPKVNPPSFNYGLENEGILSNNELAVLLTSSEELLSNVQNINSSELKALLVALNNHCEDFGVVLNPTDGKTEIAVVFYAKNGITEPSMSSQTSHLIPEENLAIKGFLYLQKGLIDFIDALNKNDKGGSFRKILGPAMPPLSQKLISKEISFGIYENNGKVNDFIVATWSENQNILINLLKVVVEDAEPVGSLSTLKLREDSPIVKNIPVKFVIGYKEPLFVVASSVELLQKVDSKITGGNQQESNDVNCKLGYVKIDKEKVTRAIESVKIKGEDLAKIKTILPKLSDICINYKSNWGIIKINMDTNL